MLPNERVLGLVWGGRGDDTDEPTDIFTEPRVGYRLPEVPREGQRPD